MPSKTKRIHRLPRQKFTTAGAKRKSDTSVDDKNDKLFPKDVPRISEDDPRLFEISRNADTIRNKIRVWIDFGAQKVGEFQDTIGVSPTAYNAFMRGHGPRGGIQSTTYEAAGIFFRERQLQGLPQKLPASASKKAKTADKAKIEALLEVPADVTLPGEKEGNVPVYETCDSMRRQVRALLKKDGITQAAYLRTIAKCIPGEPKIQPRALRNFLGLRGPVIGCASPVFYGSYVFFEKRRVKEGKPKSKFRQEMEEVHGDKGMDVEHDPRYLATYPPREPKLQSC